MVEQRESLGTRSSYQINVSGNTLVRVCVRVRVMVVETFPLRRSVSGARAFLHVVGTRLHVHAT